MCDKAFEEDPGLLWPVPGQCKTQEMCDKAVEEGLGLLEYVPDHLKRQSMCDKAFQENALCLQYIPGWFVTQEQRDLWGDDDYYYDDDEFIEWYEGYQKRKAQKAKIKKELLPIAWSPDRIMNWCMSEDEKRQWK